jgi:hypothetical protein
VLRAAHLLAHALHAGGDVAGGALVAHLGRDDRIDQHHHVCAAERQQFSLFCAARAPCVALCRVL